MATSEALHAELWPLPQGQCPSGATSRGAGLMGTGPAVLGSSVAPPSTPHSRPLAPSHGSGRRRLSPAWLSGHTALCRAVGARTTEGSWGGGVERDQLGPPPCPWAWQVPLRGCGSAHRSGLAAPQDPPFCPVAGGLQGPSQPCSAAWRRATGRPPPPRDRRHGLAPLISGAVAAPFLRGLLDHFSSFLSRSASRGWETRHVGLSVRKRG